MMCKIFLGTSMVFNLINLNQVASSLSHNKTFAIYRVHNFKKVIGLYALNTPNKTKTCQGTPPKTVQNMVAVSNKLIKLFILKVYNSIKICAFSKVIVTGLPYRVG